MHHSAAIWLGPAALVLVWAGPIVLIVAGSFFRLNVADPHALFQLNELSHYRRVISSGEFWGAVLRTFQMTLLVVAGSIAIGSLAGWGLLGVHRRIARPILGAFLVPLFLPPVVSALIWYFQSNPQYGPVGHGLYASTGRTLLGPDLAFASICIFEVWRISPFFALLVFLGGRSFERSLRDTVVIYRPKLGFGFLGLLIRKHKPMIGLGLFLGIAMAARAFESIFVTTGGGPGTLTETLPMLVHRTAFQRFELGYAAAQSVIYDVILVVVLGQLCRVVAKS